MVDRNEGVGKPAKFWSHNITRAIRFVDAVSTPMWMETVMAGRLKPAQLATRRFQLAELLKVHDTFGNAVQQAAWKVRITNGTA